MFSLVAMASLYMSGMHIHYSGDFLIVLADKINIPYFT